MSQFKKNIISFYESLSTNYDFPDPIQLANLKSIIPMLSSLDGKKVLEIAAGTGHITKHIVNYKIQSLHIIEPTMGMIKKLQEKTSIDDKYIYHSTFEDWQPVENQLFDVIVCSMVLDHVEDINFWFKKMNDILTQNGQIILSTANPYLQKYVCGGFVHNSNTGEKIEAILHDFSSLFKAWKKNNLFIDDISEYKLSEEDILKTHGYDFNIADSPVLAFSLLKNTFASP